MCVWSSMFVHLFFGALHRSPISEKTERTEKARLLKATGGANAQWSWHGKGSDGYWVVGDLPC